MPQRIKTYQNSSIQSFLTAQIYINIFENLTKNKKEKNIYSLLDGTKQRPFYS